MGKLVLILFLLGIIGPLWKALSGQIDFAADYRTASRDSAHIAPDPTIVSDAVIQAYSAYAFNWRGMVAVHTWIAVKPKDAKTYTVYQVVGWRTYMGLSPVDIEKDLSDRYWYNQKPDLIFDLRGEKAEKLIPKIAQAAQEYPYANQYIAWPGPNSNTFIAFIARQIPELKLTLPANALGKDYLGVTHFFAPAASGTGYQISILGILGITLSVKEGVEINILGLVYGINPMTLTFKLPGFGDIKLGQIIRKAT